MREALPPSLPLDELERHDGGAGLPLRLRPATGAVAGRWERGDPRGAEAVARRLLRPFGPDRFRVELQRPLWRRDRARNRWLAELAERLGVPCVATGNAHAHDRSRLPLQDALVAVRLGATLDETEGAAARQLRGGPALGRPRRPSASATTPRRWPRRCGWRERLRFDLTRDLGYSYPGAEDPTADRRLAELCRARLEQRYPPAAAAPGRGRAAAGRGAGADPAAAAVRLLPAPPRHAGAGARGRRWRCAAPTRRAGCCRPAAGRGSSVSSIVCYLTGLSHIDPVANDLFLGRFLNEELTDAPGHRPRLPARHPREADPAGARALRARALGAGRGLLHLPGARRRCATWARRWGCRRARSSGWRARWTSTRRAATPGRGSSRRWAAARARSPRWRALAELLPEIAGLPRHISQHPGGMVISTRPLVELCPVQPAAMEGRQIVQWDKDSCADAGFLKIDLLGLGMLSAVERCVDEIARSRGERIDLSRVPLDDDRGLGGDPARRDDRRLPDREPGADADAAADAAPRTSTTSPCRWRSCARARSRAAPSTPTSSGASGCARTPTTRSPTSTPRWSRCCSDTLGAIVFQDQVLEVAMALAGFSVGEAEGLRRAMSRKRSEAAILRYRRRFIEGAMERGVEPGGRRAGLRPDRGVLGLRLPQVALGGLRAARLPVDLAAGPLRAGVALRAAERAADGLLSARRAGARGAAARARGAAARRQRERARLPGGDARGGGRDRPGSRRSGSGSATWPRWRRSTPRRWSPSGGAAAPTATSPTWPGARGPRGRRCCGWPGRAPATALARADAAGSLADARPGAPSRLAIAEGAHRRPALWAGRARPARAARVRGRDRSWRCRWTASPSPRCPSWGPGSGRSPTTG